MALATVAHEGGALLDDAALGRAEPDRRLGLFPHDANSALIAGGIEGGEVLVVRARHVIGDGGL